MSNNLLGKAIELMKTVNVPKLGRNTKITDDEAVDLIMAFLDGTINEAALNALFKSIEMGSNSARQNLMVRIPMLVKAGKIKIVRLQEATTV